MIADSIATNRWEELKVCIPWQNLSACLPFPSLSDLAFSTQASPRFLFSVFHLLISFTLRFDISCWHELTGASMSGNVWLRMLLTLFEDPFISSRRSNFLSLEYPLSPSRFASVIKSFWVEKKNFFLNFRSQRNICHSASSSDKSFIVLKFRNQLHWHWIHRHLSSPWQVCLHRHPENRSLLCVFWAHASISWSPSLSNMYGCDLMSSSSEISRPSASCNSLFVRHE